MPNLTPEIADAISHWKEHGHEGETKMDVHKALELIPVVNRRIVILRFFEGMTFAECGEAMNITAGQARRLFLASALALKKVMTRNPKLVPLVSKKLVAKG